MSEDGRAERIARYKEQRRKELAAQFSDPSRPRRNSKDSSSSEGPRPTRASRLRAAALENAGGSPARLNSTEKLPASPTTTTSHEVGVNASRRVERDKSSKRKSNLNRSLNSEEVPGSDLDDVKSRRRRRRFFPQEVLDPPNDETSKSDTNLTASFLSQSSTSPITASPTSRLTPRKSELSIHMENARRGVTPSYSELGKNKTRRVTPPKDESKTRNIHKKMEELRALTKETLARVEHLASRNKELPKQIKRASSSPIKADSCRSRVDRPSSILKKKIEEAVIVESVPNTAPVSILKRKISQDDKAESSTHTPPVTFSPSVVEPVTTNRKQGILKKRRSLDESQVLRHRSCSPDVANKPDSRSILKNQRRSSLEELTRTQSPEPHLHGILKRKTSRTEEDDSLNSPQSILKRRSGASSAGSTSSTPHVSITTAVILAAAGGAEMILESEAVKPILKKKSFSEEHSYSETSQETPKPILKKKSSTDTDECEERPKKPILKISRNSQERDSFDTHDECDVRPILKQNGDVRPRLSFCGEREQVEEVRRSRRSHTICAEFNIKTEFSKEEDRQLKKPRPLSVSELVMNFETSSSTGAIPKRSSMKRSSDRYRTQPVTSNELEASLNLVRSPQLEASPKLSSPLVSPVSNSLLDFTSSLENDSQLNSFLLHNTSPDSGVCGKMSSDSAFQSLGDGLELDQEEDKVAEVAARKLEPNRLEMQMKAIAEEAQKMKLTKGNAGVQKYRNRKSNLTERPSSSRFSTQPVTFDEVQEAARMNKKSDESEDKDEPDPSNLSLCERIKLFNVKLNEDKPQKRDVPRRRLNRFQTQPVTSDEVETARCISPTTNALDDDRPAERRGILKSSFGSARARGDSPSPHPRSVLKKRDSFDGSDYDGPNRRSILKTEIADVTYDEGISCNDSASDSESTSVPSYSLKSPEIKVERAPAARQTGAKYVSNSETSDGDSSGGREVRSIFKNESKLKVKQRLETVLSKSKSQSAFGDETESLATRKGSSIRRSQTQSAMPRAIEELQAKLQQSGESGWRKRVQQNNNSNDELKLLNMNRYNNELSEKSILEVRKDELDAASKQWKSRVEKSDAEKFSVAGRMEKNREEANLPINIPMVDNKKTPQAKRFKGKEGSDCSSTPVSPDKNRHVELTRSYSVPDPDQDSSGSDTSLRASGRKVSVSRPDDDTFTTFYKSVVTKTTSQIEVSLDDLDSVPRQSLLVQKKNVQVQKRRGASRNPVKALATRNDITNEYTEVITGVAERERKRLNIEKLAKSSNMAHAALAGLVSKEDFKAVALKKSSYTGSLNPYKDVMLLQVKGRQHVQTRMVEPVVESINEGDCYILITPSTVYNYVGKYSNVIEQSRASEIINHIQQTGDLGCKEVEVVTLNSDNSSIMTRQVKKFWETLGSKERQVLTSGGNPEEDGIYESNILATNMIYKLEGDELVPLEEFWGRIPKIDMLEQTKVIVFDFGSEMYVWSGKNAPLEKKKQAFRLAKEMWDLGYDYSDCNINPLNVATILGNRQSGQVSRTSNSRPTWALFAKITQHRETILFKEKFLDWPDFSRIIKVKGEQNKTVDPSYNIKACDVVESSPGQPDLVVEHLHLGRGDSYFDEETKRLYEFETLKISVWRILENHPEQLSEDSIGHFYNSDSYIVKWQYRTTVKGRELSGKPSRHLQGGRDRCIYFCWQGSNASINEKGSAALLTVELDHEKAPQVRVVQSFEPAVFLKMFRGSFVVHDGKRDETENHTKPRLFIMRGELPDEVSLTEIPPEMRNLRSRSSFLLVESNCGRITVWHGCKSSQKIKELAKISAERIVEKRAEEFHWGEEEIEVVEVEEGEETEEFLEAVEGHKSEYSSLLGSEGEFDFTMRLFHLSSVSRTFTATEVLCPHRSEYSSPYPFLQSEIYSASQPALFLIDNHHELWLWQGWWPEREDEEVELSDQTGSGAVRWQAERKAAMQTAVDYWRRKKEGPVRAYLVWAGLEPLEFKNLFPFWVEREDVAELNLKDGRVEGKLELEEQLEKLLRTTYPLEELLQRPLPEGVDPTQLEIYLSAEDFEGLLNMSKEEFQRLPPWKQTSLKKEKGLF